MIVESALSSREIIYFVFGDGCAACEAAAPEIEKFMLAHPGMLVLRINASGPILEKLGIKIKATPTYLYRRGNEIAAHVGMLTKPQIEKWLKQARSGT